MKILLLLFALAAIVAACPPLFNDLRFLGNETHTTADLVQALYDRTPDLGRNEIITHVRRH